MKRRLLAAVLSAFMMFTSVNVQSFAMNPKNMDDQMMQEALENGECVECVYVNPLYEDVITLETECNISKQRAVYNAYVLKH